MKFKDKDGNVFEKIEDALKKYCQSRKCPNCVIEKRTLQTKLYACSSFCNAHPAESARLMGYEVVEDEERCEDRECAPPYGDKEDCDLYDGGSCKAVKKEANMDNPCKWCRDEFCVNADSPMRADYCPVPDIPGVCKHEDRVVGDEGEGMDCTGENCPLELGKVKRCSLHNCSYRTHKRRDKP